MRDIKDVQAEALALVQNCVRNSLEDLHAGTFPSSATGDYTDVKVVSPYGEIPWNKVGRISDEEMRELMIAVVNRVFTFLLKPEGLLLLPSPKRWNTPELSPDMLPGSEKLAAMIDAGKSTPK